MIHAVPGTLAARFGGRLRQAEPLAPHTSFRVGGPADLFLQARTRDDIADAVTLARAAGLPWLVLGRGSNVLIDDRGVRRLVIRNDATAFSFDPASGRAEADGGVRLPTIGAQTAKAGLAGFEWAVGIPGSVGGAVVMNAGAHGGCTADVLVSAEVLNGDERGVWPAAAFEHTYRTSRLQSDRDVVVLGASFQLRPSNPAEALGRVQAYRKHRQDTQPTDPGAGSIFRNPPDNSSGRLIEQAGLKGTRRGDALISPKHGNFIVNVGHASSADVLALIDLARETVFRQFGIALRPEMEYLGPEGRVNLEHEAHETTTERANGG